MDFTPDELLEMERQLGCPSGKNGIQVAEIMHQSNIGMIRQSIEVLALQNNDSILELGHGSAAHLSDILDKAEGLNYLGLEISETMRDEAIRRNATLSNSATIKFKLYDGSSIPFPDQNFHKIITVNTLYFWNNPIDLLNEIHRVLKTRGLCAIAYAQKEFMKNLPFVQQKFTLYGNDDVVEIIEKSLFNSYEILDYTEEVYSKTNEKVKRDYSILLLKK